MGTAERRPVNCLKCGKSTWAPYEMRIRGKYGQVYLYQVYRHPDGRRRTPRKCTVKTGAVEGSAKYLDFSRRNHICRHG